MSLRDDLIAGIASACSTAPTDDLPAMANSMGYASGLCQALLMAETAGVSDGENWKAKYETLLSNGRAVLDKMNQRELDLAAAQRRIEELESLLDAVVPDVPEEGIDDAA